MSLFAKALRCLYQDKDAVYLWPEGFAACAAVCAESRASLDDVWTDLGSMTDAYVLRLASALHTDPYIAAMRAAEDSEGEDGSDEGPDRLPLDFRKLFAGRKTQPLKGALMRELILRELNDAKERASNLLAHYEHT